MEKENGQGVKNWVKSKSLGGEALIIAGLSAIIYLAAYTCQLAYLWYFGVPLLFVDIRLVDALFVGLVGLLWVLANVIFFGQLIGKEKTFNTRRLYILAWVAVIQMFFPILIIFISPLYPVRTIIIALTIFLVCFFLVRDLKNDNDSRKNGVDRLLDKIEASCGTLLVLFVFLGIFFIFYGAGLGFIMAKFKTDFSVPSTQPNIAIVSMQGDNYIGIVFDQESKRLTDKIKLITPEQITENTVFEIKSLVPAYNYKW